MNVEMEIELELELNEAIVPFIIFVCVLTRLCFSCVNLHKSSYALPWVTRVWFCICLGTAH